MIQPSVVPSIPDSLDTLNVTITVEETRLAITKQLLQKDRARASDVLLQLRYQFSRTTSSIEVK